MARPNPGSNAAAWGWAWGPACLWAVVIWYASALIIVPGMFPPIRHGDKLFHGGEFCVYGYFVCRGVVHRRWPIRWRAWGVVMLVMLTAALDEWHQAFVPTRAPDLLDGFADLAGGLMGFSAFPKAPRA